jgi:glycosyltransferase involved in cell wall biosynthesis
LSFGKDLKKIEIVSGRFEELNEVIIYTRASATGINFLDSFINLYRFFLANWKGLQKIRKEQGLPDLLHVNVLTRCGFIALLNKWFTGVPYVITEHWTRYLYGMGSYNGWLRKKLSVLVVKYASAVMPVTVNLQKAMEKHGLLNRRYVVIPNVVDTKLFVPTEAQSDLKQKMILHVSCFDDGQKNISGILRVLKLLSIRRNDWRCIMVGEGIHFEKLVKYADELGLKDTFVFFAGLKENQELVGLMQKATVQVMFSRYENLPVVIPESFACGVPFLSTDVGGISEHIHEFSGRLFASEDEEALLKWLDYMLDHSEDFSKVVIRKYAVDHFSMEVIGKQIGDVYEKVLSNRYQ